jgi:hypothetical protein
MCERENKEVRAVILFCGVEHFGINSIQFSEFPELVPSNSVPEVLIAFGSQTLVTPQNRKMKAKLIPQCSTSWKKICSLLSIVFNLLD